jgi:hypothetical protein
MLSFHCPAATKGRRLNLQAIGENPELQRKGLLGQPALGLQARNLFAEC